MEENGGMDGSELSVTKIPCVVKSTFVNSRLNIACNFVFTVYIEHCNKFSRSETPFFVEFFFSCFWIEAQVLFCFLATAYV